MLVSNDYAVDVYQQMAQNIQIENLMAIAGGVFGIATSVLSFNTMNFLYFEEFRKQIFLKKIAGLGFVNIHQMILLSESSLLLLGSLLGIHSHFGMVDCSCHSLSIYY